MDHGPTHILQIELISRIKSRFKTDLQIFNRLNSLMKLSWKELIVFQGRWFCQGYIWQLRFKRPFPVSKISFHLLKVDFLRTLRTCVCIPSLQKAFICIYIRKKTTDNMMCWRMLKCPGDSCPGWDPASAYDRQILLWLFLSTFIFPFFEYKWSFISNFILHLFSSLDSLRPSEYSTRPRKKSLLFSN